MTSGETTAIDRPVLVTGGAGFIGSNFVHHMIERGYPVVTLDALTYAGNRANLSKLEDNPQHVFVEGSILDRKLVTSTLSTYKPRAVVNFAAESHVDRSIDGPSAFIETNIVGVYTLLEAFNSYFTSDAGRDAKFLHVSTDEVYGSLESGAASESSVYAPTSPYAAESLGGPSRLRMAENLRHAGNDHELFEQLWTVSIPRKTYPLDDPESGRRRSIADLWQRTSRT